MKQVLVTGGAGFIGSHLVRALLDQGYAVIVLDNLSSGKKDRLPAGASLIVGDVADDEVWAACPKTIDFVFHLAAQIDVRLSVSQPYLDARTNVMGTVNVLSYAYRAQARRLIFSSSGGAIYGPADAIPTPEDARARSSSPYGVAKLVAEEYISLYGRLHQLKSTILRYSNVYGPGQDGSKESGVIAVFTQRAAKGKPLTIFGDGEQTRDFVYVKDVVAANLAALERGVDGTFNIGTGKETSINALVKTLQALVDHPLEVSHGPARLGEERRSCLAIDRARTNLAWSPKYGLEEGLRETIESLG